MVGVTALVVTRRKNEENKKSVEGVAQERRVARIWKSTRQTFVNLPRESLRQRITRLFKSKQSQVDEEYGILPHQYQVRMWYNNKRVQIVVAGLIFGNFIVSATEAQVHRSVTEGSTGEQVFFALEIFFNAAFAIELVVNMYAHFCVPFWKSAWNVFDFTIVCISLVSMFMSNLPGIGVLRLFRAFRVFRLFKRIKSLRVIIEAVVKSVPGVMNAFMILALIMAIWAIMSVEFFGERMKDEFGTFLRAMLTFFQIMTLDGWASGIMRPLMCSEDDLCKSVNIMTIAFFLAYVLINAVMMANVVVAILLDKFIDEMTKLRDQEKAEEEENMLGKEAEAEAARLVESRSLTVCAPKTSQVYTPSLSTLEENKEMVENIDRVLGLQPPGFVETAPDKNGVTTNGAADSASREFDPDRQAKHELLRFEAHALKRLREITSELTHARSRLADLARDLPASKAGGMEAAMSAQLRSSACALEGDKTQPQGTMLPPMHEGLELISAALPNSASHCVGGG
mmetsp:Transcript_130479/g.239954  ORF Transcript_130479/g.239954 Transcript_130479/m.239954 type:complete len:512 (-) Transcript_130479:11-1546(-)